MTWIESVPVFIAALAAVFLPGLAITAAAGARRLVLYAAAPAVTFAVMGVLGVVFAFVRIPWGLISVSVAVALITLSALVVRRFVARRWFATALSLEASDHASGTRSRWTLVGLGAAAVIIATQLMVVIGSPEHVSQTLDGMFHLNGVRYVLDQADASSFHLTGLILPAGQQSLYPAAWHSVVSLAAALASGNVVAAANVTNIVLAALVWPSGVMMLVRALAPTSKVALVAVGPISAAFPGFPLLPLDYGVLFPYFSALTLLPFGLALALALCRCVTLTGTTRVGQFALLATVFVACGLTQPAVAFALVAMLVPVVLAVTIRGARCGGILRAVLSCAAFIAFLVVAALVWKYAASVGSTAPWGPKGTAVDAAVYVLGNFRPGIPAVIIVSVLVIVGLVAVLLQRRWWLASMWAVAAFLFALAIALPSGDWRNLLIGVFYKDIPRLSAILAVAAVPLAVLGVVAVCAQAQRVLRLSERPVLERVLAVVGSLLLLASTAGPSMQASIAHAQRSYDPSDAHAFLSPDEIRLIDRLPREVPKGAIVAGSPWTGTAFAYALSGINVLNPHFYWSADAATRLINEHLDEAGRNPAVCDAVEQLNVRFVLDFGVGVETSPDYVNFDSRVGYEGLTGLENSGAVELVDRVGKNRLYRIVACGGV